MCVCSLACAAHVSERAAHCLDCICLACEMPVYSGTFKGAGLKRSRFGARKSEKSPWNGVMHAKHIRLDSLLSGGYSCRLLIGQLKEGHWNEKNGFRGELPGTARRSCQMERLARGQRAGDGQCGSCVACSQAPRHLAGTPPSVGAQHGCRFCSEVG